MCEQAIASGGVSGIDLGALEKEARNTAVMDSSGDELSVAVRNEREENGGWAPPHKCGVYGTKLL